MSGDDGKLATKRMARRGRTMAAISPLPSPEQVFIDWLMSEPHGADLEEAARRKIAVIDRSGVLHPDVLALRALLAAVAETGGREAPAALRGEPVWSRREAF